MLAQFKVHCALGCCVAGSPAQLRVPSLGCLASLKALKHRSAPGLTRGTYAQWLVLVGVCTHLGTLPDTRRGIAAALLCFLSCVPLLPSAKWESVAWPVMEEGGLAFVT